MLCMQQYSSNNSYDHDNLRIKLISVLHSQLTALHCGNNYMYYTNTTSYNNEDIIVQPDVIMGI